MATFQVIRESLLVAKDGPARDLLGVNPSEMKQHISKSIELKTLTDEIAREAQRAATEPLPELSYGLFKLFKTKGSRLEYEAVYFERRRRLLALALSVWLAPSDRGLEVLNDLIWNICGEYTWCLPAHLPQGLDDRTESRKSHRQTVDLFNAETAQTLSELDFLLGDLLPPEIRSRIRKEVNERVLYLYEQPVINWWESETMNWASVCGGSAGMAALLLYGDSTADTNKLATLLERVLRTMDCFMEGYGKDGGCPEGIGYWTYGFGYYVYFSEMLFARTSGALNLLDHPKVFAAASFPAAVYLTGQTYVNFSDAPFRSELPSGLLSRLRSRLGVNVPPFQAVTSFHSDHCYRWAPKLRDLLWTDIPVNKHLDIDTKSSYYLDDLEWFIDHIEVSHTLFVFAAKGGHNDEPHNHNDSGHFIVQIGEDALLCDLGAGEYTKDSFGPLRYEFIHNASSGHSVPIIAGKQQRAGKEHKAKVIVMEQEGSTKKFELELSEAYAIDELQQLTRTFQWTAHVQNRVELVLEDRFSFTETGVSCEEIFISKHKPEIGDNQCLIWSGKLGKAVMTYDTNAWKLKIEEIQTHDHDGSPFTVYRSRLARLNTDKLEQNFSCKISLISSVLCDAQI